MEQREPENGAEVAPKAEPGSHDGEPEIVDDRGAAQEDKKKLADVSNEGRANALRFELRDHIDADEFEHVRWTLSIWHLKLTSRRSRRAL